MTRISISDQRLTVQRTGVGRWLGSPVDVPLAHVVSVAQAEPAEAKRWYKGIRLAGIQIPGLMTSGQFRQDGQAMWWDVRRGGKVLVITLRDEPVAKLMIEVDDPATVARSLDRALAGTDDQCAGGRR